MKFIPHNYQIAAIEHVINNPCSGLFMEMGLGKSVTTLTAIDRLINDYMEVSKVLVIAPKRVAESTWSDEVEKWDHLKGLTISKVLGPECKRKEALKKKADIYVINRENVAWLVAHYQGHWPFDMLVIDELSSFKSSKAERFKALRMVRPRMSRVVGLTGTPAPNGLIDLWSQMYLIDMGARLEKTITRYRSLYFRPGRTNGQVVFDYKANEGSEQEIYRRISDVCISLKNADYLSLAGLLDRRVNIVLPGVIKSRYEALEREQIMLLDNGDDISAVNAAALSNKLLQFANGSIYDADRNVHHIHDEKLNALEEIVDVANGQPVLVFYAYKHDLHRILSRLKKYKPRQLDTPEDIKAWNRGEIQVMLAHPAGAGHGLNLQAGGNTIVWFGLTWSLELYQQANARLHRQGQTKPVIVHHLVAKGTMDEDVMKAIEGKAGKQEALMQAIKARIQKYRA
jgi:SNF2 family DNA or RNA helicase